MTINEVNQAMTNMRYYVSEFRNTFLGYDVSKASEEDLQCFKDLDIIDKLIELCGNNIKARLRKKECNGFKFA